MKFDYAKLRNIREAKNVSMQKAAAHVNHNVSWLSSVETGRTAPNINDLLSLMDLYNEPLISVIRGDQLLPGDRSYIKKLRICNGWSTEEAAKILGCSVSDWINYENKTKPMNMIQTLKLLEAAGIKSTKQAQAVHKIVTEYLEANKHGE